MRISVIVPVYNCEAYLKQCLESLMIQYVKEIEFIIVNDGSTDNTEKIMEKYRTFPNFIMLNKKNGGVSSARNFGMRFAKGEYIGFVDSDDWVDNNMFSEMLYAAERNHYPDIIQCNYVRNQNEMISRQPIEKGYYDQGAISEEIVPKLLSYINADGNIKSVTPYNVIKLYKRSMLQNNEIWFNEKISNGEDRLFNFEAFLRAKSYYYMGDEYTFYHYRYNPDSQSVRFIKAMWTQRQIYIDELIRIAEQTNIINQVDLHIYAASIYCLWNELKDMNNKKECIQGISAILSDPRQERWIHLELDKKLNKDNLRYYQYFINKNAKKLYSFVKFNRKKKRYLKAIRRILTGNNE